MRAYLRGMKRMARAIAPAALLLCLCGTALAADDVMDSINQAVESYKSGDFAEAANNLDYAAQLIRQKRGAGLQAFLPEPLPGWKAEEKKSQTISPMMLGGMVSAERVYKKGSSSVTVKIVTDSPMLQAMAMMLSNPMLVGADGGTLQKIKGQKALVKMKPSSDRGEIHIVVAGRILVSVEGNGVEQQDLIDYASAIDYAKLEKS